MLTLQFYFSSLVACTLFCGIINLIRVWRKAHSKQHCCMILWTYHDILHPMHKRNEFKPIPIWMVKNCMHQNDGWLIKKRPFKYVASNNGNIRNCCLPNHMRKHLIACYCNKVQTMRLTTTTIKAAKTAKTAWLYQICVCFFSLVCNVCIELFAFIHFHFDYYS